ncbi:MAG TPA: hypothetical protein V6D46_04445 [Coleofasciculaceae cyanobacterium]
MIWTRFTFPSVFAAIVPSAVVTIGSLGLFLVTLQTPRSAWATPPGITLEIPIYTLTKPHDLLNQAEGLAQETIARQFQQQPNLDRVRLVVLGNRHGNVVPILTVAVTRSQWQRRPQVDSWAQYYASGTLLQRPDRGFDEQWLAARPIDPAASGASAVDPRRVALDRAVDEGQLTRSQAQEQLSDID